MVTCSSRSVAASGSPVADHEVAGVLVDHQPPEPLQEALSADHVPGLPGPGHIEWTHRHLVHPEDIGAVGLADLVRGDHVVEGLAHLPVLAAYRCALVDEGPRRVLDDLRGGDVDPPVVGVGVRLDVTLVEQSPVRLLAGDVAEIEQDLVPEAGVEEVQDGVLDPAHVEVHPTGIAGASRVLAHPVALVRRIAEGIARWWGRGSAARTSTIPPTAASRSARGCRSAHRPRDPAVRWPTPPLGRGAAAARRWRPRGPGGWGRSRPSRAGSGVAGHRAGHAPPRRRRTRSGTARPSSAAGRTASPAACTGSRGIRIPCCAAIP